jgi:hypothetical protein
VPAGDSDAGGSLHTRVSAEGVQWLREHRSESELGLLRLHAMAELANSMPWQSWWRRRGEQAVAQLLLGYARKRGGRQGVRARSEGEAHLDSIWTGLLTRSEARRSPLVACRRAPRGCHRLERDGSGSCAGAGRERLVRLLAGPRKRRARPSFKTSFSLKTKTIPKLATFCTVAQRISLFSQNFIYMKCSS